MDKLSFDKFLANESIHVSLYDFMVNIVLTIILSQVLAYTYNKYSKSFSDRNIISSNFIYIATTTMIITTITIVLKNSLIGDDKSFFRNTESIIFLYF